MPHVGDVMNLVADVGFDWRPRARHVLLAASFVAHSLAFAWIVCPGRVQRLAYTPEHVTLATFEMMPRVPCADAVWIETHSGCVVTRRRVCRSNLPIDDKRKHDER